LSSDPYSPVVRDYFSKAPHAGDLADAVTVEIAEQGVRLRLAATEEDGRIRALRFRAWGCPHVIAACECFCVEYEGRPVQSFSGFQASDIMRILSVPVEKTGRILVLEDAVRSLGRVLCSDSAPQ
jgi:NifU-like protein involved in Fe-S cluster formation